MENIKRINMQDGTVDTITVFDSEITRWFKENNIDIGSNLIKVNSTVSGFDKEETEKVAIMMQHAAAAGLIHNGKIFRPFMAAASDVRKGTSTWVSDEVYGKLFKWAMCGLNKEAVDGKIAINKFMAYIGLLSSASKRFEEAFGHKLSIRRFAVIKDCEINVSGIMDVVAGTMVNHDVNRNCVINAFDGLGIIRSEYTNGESPTIRAPQTKAFVQAVLWNRLKKFGTKFIDLWGNEVSIDDVDVILTESCFKAAKLYSSWEQYCDAFEKLGHNVCVCVREHAPKAKGMPYQQGQTLLGNKQDAEEFANYASQTISKYTNAEEAVALLPKAQRLVAKIYPALMLEAHTARTLQDKYTSKRLSMLGGRIPELGYNAFLAPDMVAFAQHLFGLEVTGSLKAGECSCSNCEIGDVDVTRNPHLDNAHCILRNVGTMRLVPLKSPTMFINIFDLTTIKIRADYDGDHVWYSQNKMLLDLVKKTIKEIGASSVDWNVAKAPKSAINRSTIAKFIAGLLKGSEIGLYADAMTKMWNWGYDRDTCNWLTYAGNVLIDAAKHASAKVTKPDAVKELDTTPLPYFCRYAKADAEHPYDSPYWDEMISKTIRSNGEKVEVEYPRTAYTGSFLDMYSKKVGETVSETLTVKGLEDIVFDPYVMLINPLRKIGKLAGISKKAMKYDKEKGCYIDGGLFQKIAFRHSDEWKEIIKVAEDKTMTHMEWEREKAKEAKAELIAFARAQYPDVEADDEIIWSAIYDIVTRNIFSVLPGNTSIAYDDCVKREYWAVFGEKALQVVADNVGEDVLANFSADDDEDEDID